ncbi:MAG: hypothetical protein ACQEQ0_04950 [Bacteroidota bacterium]
MRKSKTTLNYFQKIRKTLPDEQFARVMNEIHNASEREQEAFWQIITSGYPTSFALSNYKNLHEYVKNRNINYTEALGNMYEIYPGLEAGIRIKYPEWYKLN